MKLSRYIFIVLTLAACFLYHETAAQEFRQAVNLQGAWKFMIGDDMAWSKSDYNDEHWETINVPMPWEEQGFHGYDGYAWYRKKVAVRGWSAKRKYYLDIGFIDDVDQVYLNGVLIGMSGYFPPGYSTAYNARRLYPIPQTMVQQSGELTIAVRVYDEVGEGGIIHGNISIREELMPLLPDIDLQGLWEFKTGNCPEYGTGQDPTSWDTILVPGIWENQGYKNYDGLACYQREFYLDEKFGKDKMVLLLGKIDDVDIVYINGKLVGQSGRFDEETVRQRSENYRQARGYYIPDNVLIPGASNVIRVKVLDWYGQGGIWEGTVGLITQENYIDYWRSRKNARK